MWGFITIGVLAYLGYTYKRGPRRAPHQPSNKFCPTPVTRSEQQGEIGEKSVDAELRRVLSRLCEANFYLHPCALLIEHAPGTAFPTAEIDHLAITPFGLFVVETKNWTGTISRGATLDTVLRVGPDGTSEQRKSPDAQNRTKVAFLRGVLPAVWPVHGVGVFASLQCAVSPDLPLSIVHIGELEHWLRARQAAFDREGSKPVDVQLAWEGIQKIAQTDAAALALHRKKPRENPNFYDAKV